MNRKHMKGFVDPITLGFIIAIAGTALGVHFGTQDQAVSETATPQVAQLEESQGPATFAEE
jgi:hypothetical protein